MGQPLPDIALLGGLVPYRKSSLPNASKHRPPYYDKPSPAFWPVPDDYYHRPHLGPINEEELFPGYEDPAKSLIIERTKIVEALYYRTTALALSEHAGILRFTALMSRITNSGHIKPNEDGTRVRISVEESIECGENHRTQQKLGNRRWLAHLRKQYITNYSNSEDPEPKIQLREQMKTRCRQGLQQALDYEEDFGMGIINEAIGEAEQDQERGRTVRRPHSAVFHRKKVVTALLTLRNSYPDEFNAAPAPEYHDGKSAEMNTASKKAKTVKVRTPVPSPTKPMPSPTKRLSIHSNASNVFFASFVSVDTFGAAGKKVTSKVSKATAAIRHVVSKIPVLERFADEKRDIPVNSATTWTFDPELDLEYVAHQAKMERVSAWACEFNGAPDALELEETKDEGQPSTPLATLASSDEIACKPSAKEFSIDAGIVLLSTPIQEFYELAAASTVLPSVAELPAEPFSPPPKTPLVKVKARKRDRFVRPVYHFWKKRQFEGGQE